MFIEIRKAGFSNKGSELMLYAVIDKLKQRYPDIKIAMCPSGSNGSQPFNKIVECGMYLKLWHRRGPIQWGDFLSIIPKSFRRRYGLVLDKEIKIVFDLAGYAYGDPRGISNSKELVRALKKWKKRGTKLIMMPQAFGPFETLHGKKLIRQIIQHSELVFVREEESYSNIEVIGRTLQNVLQYPDFTNLIPGKLPIDFDQRKNRIAIIPNYRMIDKTHQEDSKAYLPMMIMCSEELLKRDLKPFLLIHEGKSDEKLAEQIAQAVGNIDIILESDALKIKGIIGACDATIGSRFHGLVSALSQGVPSLATGWSHKYQQLFNDYSFPEGIISVHDKRATIQNKISLITNKESRDQIVTKLMDRSEKLKIQAEEMWEHIYKIVDEMF